MTKALTWIVAVTGSLLLVATLSPHSSATAATAVTFTVNTVLDQLDVDTGDGLCLSSAGLCSLRAAIMQANHFSSPGETTIIVPPGTYTLTRPQNGANGEDNGDLNLTTPLSADQNVVISGAGASSTIIDAQQIDRVFDIRKDRTVTIRRLTIRNGLAQSNAGGGILTEGKLTVGDAVIENNSTQSVGGGLSAGGVVTVSRSILRSNHAGGSGGGAYLGATSMVVIRDSTLADNNSNDQGGGVFVYTGGTAYLVNSTLSNNTANDSGGGAYNAGTLGLYNTTFVGNDADHDHDVLGGIGGGVFNLSGRRMIAVNSLMAGNTVMNTPVLDDCNGALESYGFNLLSEATGCVPNAGTWGLVSPNSIGPLQMNNGSTPTHALLPGSAGIDNTNDALGCVDEAGALLTTDQRGAPRPVGSRCDVGAFEYDPRNYLYLPLLRR